MTTPATFLHQQSPSILILFFTIFLFSCEPGGAGCDKYIGNWLCPEKQGLGGWTWRFNISKNGDTYIMQAKMEGFLHGPNALSCEEGKLVLKGLPLMGDVPLTLINEGETILLSGATFQKVKD